MTIRVGGLQVCRCVPEQSTDRGIRLADKRVGRTERVCCSARSYCESDNGCQRVAGLAVLQAHPEGANLCIIKLNQYESNEVS